MSLPSRYGVNKAALLTSICVASLLLLLRMSLAEPSGKLGNLFTYYAFGHGDLLSAFQNEAKTQTTLCVENAKGAQITVVQVEQGNHISYHTDTCKGFGEKNRLVEAYTPVFGSPVQFSENRTISEPDTFGCLPAFDAIYRMESKNEPAQDFYLLLTEGELIQSNCDEPLINLHTDFRQVVAIGIIRSLQAGLIDAPGKRVNLIGVMSVPNIPTDQIIKFNKDFVLVPQAMVKPTPCRVPAEYHRQKLDKWYQEFVGKYCSVRAAITFAEKNQKVIHSTDLDVSPHGSAVKSSSHPAEQASP